MDKLNKLNNNTIQVLTFKISSLLCGLDIFYVQNITRCNREITPVYLAEDYIKGIVNLRGKIITVIDLNKKLNLGETFIKKYPYIIVVKYMEEHIGLLVDEIEDIVTLNTEKLLASNNLKELKGDYFKYIYPLEKGGIIALINISKMLEYDIRC